jgi:hypothetical protein
MEALVTGVKAIAGVKAVYCFGQVGESLDSGRVPENKRDTPPLFAFHSGRAMIGAQEAFRKGACLFECYHNISIAQKHTKYIKKIVIV